MGRLLTELSPKLRGYIRPATYSVRLDEPGGQS